MTSIFGLEMVEDVEEKPLGVGGGDITVLDGHERLDLCFGCRVGSIRMVAVLPLDSWTELRL